MTTEPSSCFSAVPPIKHRLPVFTHNSPPTPIALWVHTGHLAAGSRKGGALLFFRSGKWNTKGWCVPPLDTLEGKGTKERIWIA